MGMARKHKSKPTIYIDVHEARSYRRKPCKTAANIMASSKVNWRLKGSLDDGPLDEELAAYYDVDGKYDATGDYIVVDKSGEVWGIERKTWTDCMHSIHTNRVYGQLCELVEKFGDHAVFLLEENNANPKYTGGKPKHVAKNTVLSFASHRSFLMPVLVSSGPAHSAQLLIGLATSAIPFEIKGRGLELRRLP